MDGGGLQRGGQGLRLGEKTLGWGVEILRGARKPAPEEALIAWAREWAKEKVWQ
jgi:hypothetical protein